MSKLYIVYTQDKLYISPSYSPYLYIYFVYCAVSHGTQPISSLCGNVYIVCVCVFVCMSIVYCLRECPPYQVKFLVCVHTWPIKLILILNPYCSCFSPQWSDDEACVQTSGGRVQVRSLCQSSACKRKNYTIYQSSHSVLYSYFQRDYSCVPLIIVLLVFC